MTPDRVLLAQERRALFADRTFVVPPLVADGSLFVGAARPDSYPRIVRTTLRGEPIWASRLLCDAGPISVGRIVQFFDWDCADPTAPVVTVNGDDFREELWSARIAYPVTAARVTYGYTYHFDAESELVLDDLVALDAVTGLELWRHPRPDEDGSGWSGRPLVADGHVYARLSHSIVALDADTGDPQWSVEPAPDDVIIPVAARSEVLYLARQSGTEDLRIDAVGADGTLLWSTRIPRATFSTVMNGGLAVGGGTLVASGARSVTAVDTVSGTKRWSYRLVSSPQGAPVVGAAGVFYVMDYVNARIVAIRATDGSEILGFPGARSLIVAAGRIYVTGDQGLRIYG